MKENTIKKISDFSYDFFTMSIAISLVYSFYIVFPNVFHSEANNHSDVHNLIIVIIIGSISLAIRLFTQWILNLKFINENKD